MRTATASTLSRIERSKKKRDALPMKAITRNLPKQGEWTIEDFDYFAARVTDGPPLEFSHGRLVRKAMPLKMHSLIVRYLRRMLERFVDAGELGYVFSEGAELRSNLDIARIPDVVFISSENFERSNEKGFLTADLAIEVLIASNRDEDLVKKRHDYALCGIPEYWLVDAKLKQITVLKLHGSEYIDHGVFKPGTKAISVVLNGFEVDVTEALAGGVR